MLVLVADDDRAVREALERALQLNGFDVALAADGNEALSATADRTPDALVLDVMMPGYDGLDVTRRLRREGNRVPILLLTARDRVVGVGRGAPPTPAQPLRPRRAAPPAGAPPPPRGRAPRRAPPLRGPHL